MKLSEIEKQLFVDEVLSAHYDTANLMVYCAQEGENLPILSTPVYEPISNSLILKVDLSQYLERFIKERENHNEFKYKTNPC
jgi:hypothetical protein